MIRDWHVGDAETVDIREANIRSLACGDELQEGIVSYASGLTEVLGDNLRGVYLYGSLARGCHHPSTSDVDTIVVTSDDCPEAQHPTILRVHERAGAPVDAVFVTEDQLDADVFPTPIGILVKPLGRLPRRAVPAVEEIARAHQWAVDDLISSDYKIIRVPEGRGDFLLQRQDAYEAGIALVGPDPSEIIRPVPWPLLVKSLDFLFPHIITNFKNPVLMLCRIAYAHTHRSLCGKRGAGEWALEALDERWRPMIEAALARYSQGIAGNAESSAVLQEFEGYCAGYIGSLQSNRGIVCSNSEW